jgi:hypothetical protein
MKTEGNTQIAKQLKALKAQLGSMGIKGPHVTAFPALPAQKIEALEKKHDARLPDELKSYYGQVNGHVIDWYAPGTGAVGYSQVTELQTFLAGRTFAYRNGERQDDACYSKHLDVDQRRTLEQYWVFERTYADSFVLIPKEAGSGNVPLFLLEYPFLLTELDLTLSEYIDRLFAHKALLNWQQQYKKKDKDAELMESAERILALTQGPARGAPKAPAGAAEYRERVDDLVKRVRANRRLIVVDAGAYPPRLPPLNAFKKIEKTFGSRLPEAMERFYSQVNGLKLAWRTKPDVRPAASGSIDIPPLEVAFGGQHYLFTADWDDYVTYKTLWDDELAASGPERFSALKNKRVFDRHLGRNQVLMEVTERGVELFHYVDGGVSKLDATFEEVLELVLESGGVEHYPELFHTISPDDAFVRGLEESARLVNPGFRVPAGRPSGPRPESRE